MKFPYQSQDISRHSCLRSLGSSRRQWPDGNRGQRKHGGKGGRRRKGPRRVSAAAEPGGLRACCPSCWAASATARSPSSALAKEPLEGYFEYGTAPGKYDHKTKLLAFPAGKPVEAVFDNLQADAEYFYRLHYRKPGETAFTRAARVPLPHATGHRQHIHVRRSRRFAPGTPADERPGTVCPHAAQRGRRASPISTSAWATISAWTRCARSMRRRLPSATRSSARSWGWSPNRRRCSWSTEITSRRRCSISTSRTFATTWRSGPRMPATSIIPCPPPTASTRGDTEPLKSIGPLRDYYAWTWGDALFVVLDCYWHSPAQRGQRISRWRRQAGPGRKQGPRLVGHHARRRPVPLVRGGRSSRARRSTSSSLPITSSARAAAASTSRTSMNGAARTSAAMGVPPAGGPAGNCPSINSWSSTASRSSSKGTTTSSRGRSATESSTRKCPCPPTRATSPTTRTATSPASSCPTRAICGSPCRPSR